MGYAFPDMACTNTESEKVARYGVLPHMSGLSMIDIVLGHDYTILVTGVIETGCHGIVTSRHAMFKEYSGSLNKDDAK